MTPDIFDGEKQTALIPAERLEYKLDKRWHPLSLIKGGACSIYSAADKYICKLMRISPDGQTESEMRQRGYSQAQIDDLCERMKAAAASEALVLSRASRCRNVIRMCDYGHFEADGEEFFYIVTEKMTPMPRSVTNEKEVVRFGMDICTALCDLNALDLVHRDIKPENCFFDGKSYFLGDFGTSRLLHDALSATVTGTPEFMAPELAHACGKEVTCRYDRTVDYYSLGLTMFVMLNDGDIPFLEKEGDRTHCVKRAVIRRSNGESFPNAAHADGKMMNIIRKACALMPEDRYPSAERFREALCDLYDDLR